MEGCVFMSKEAKIALAIIVGAIIIGIAIFGGFYYFTEAIRYRMF